MLLGMNPALHKGKPWGFHLDDIPDGSLEGRNIMVTGANTGIGFWTTQHLASKGAHVFMACRTRTKCESAAAMVREALGEDAVGTVECGDLDLASFDSVERFADAFLARGIPLDSLVLNAGILSDQYAHTKDGLEMMMGVNHFAQMYLTGLLLCALDAGSRRSELPSTVVVLSSAAHFQSHASGVHLSMAHLNDPKQFSGAHAYPQSKLANVLFAQELSGRLAHRGILVNSLHPGVVRTQMASSYLDMKLYFLPNALRAAITGLILSKAMWDPRDAALTVVFAAASEHVLKNGVTGKYFHPIARETNPDSKFAKNKSLQVGLWAMSENYFIQSRGERAESIFEFECTAWPDKFLEKEINSEPDKSVEKKIKSEESNPDDV